MEELAQLGAVRRLAAGTRLFHEGEPSRNVYLVRRGRLKITTVSPNGKEQLLVVREPGDLVGELSALDGRPRSATVTALDEVEVVVISAERFIEHLARTPASALAVLQTVTARLRDAERRRAEFGVHDATVRVARRLVEMSDRFGPRGLRLTQDELAGWIGASREAVARSLRQLREADVVRTARQAVDIVDIDALREIAQSVPGRGAIVGR